MSRIYNRKAFTGGEMPEALKGTAFMEEAGVDTFIISDLPLTPATGGVIAHVLRADNVAIAIDGEVNASGAAVVVLDADCYHVAGRLSVAIYVTDANEQSQCVYACVGNVWRTTSDTELDSGTVIPTLAQLETAYANAVAAAASATSAAAAAVGNFAPAFDQATANGAGTYVTYTDGKMYYLPSGHTAGTTWANTTKNEVTAGGELADLRGAMLLEQDEIPDTVQSIAFDGSGNVQSITHKKRTDLSVTVRTDTFTFAGTVITEVRTLDTGETLTIVTDTDTLVTTVTYAAA